MFDIQRILAEIAILAVPMLLAITFHEVAHGWVAYKFGDPTAKLAGRLTLNPIKHLDLFGTLAFVVTRMIGWAKPVPVNPRNFKNPRQDMLWVSLAGPAANLVLAVVFALLLQLLAAAQTAIPQFFFIPLFLIVSKCVVINVGLAIFNLLPVPPLDGSGILSGLLPLEMARQYERLHPYGFIILLALIFTGVVDIIVVPVIIFLVHLLGL